MVKTSVLNMSNYPKITDRILGFFNPYFCEVLNMGKNQESTPRVEQKISK